MSFRLPVCTISFATATSVDYQNMDITDDHEVVKIFNRPTSCTAVKLPNNPVADVFIDCDVTALYL